MQFHTTMIAGYIAKPSLEIWNYLVYLQNVILVQCAFMSTNFLGCVCVYSVGEVNFHHTKASLFLS